MVGLTGGLASGKSTVARMLAERGAVVVDADVLAREAVAEGSPAWEQVVEEFGTGVLAADGSLDREVLADVIFEDEARRRRLEEIVHPEVFRGLAERVEELRGTEAVVVFDAALLVETGFDEACDVVVVVDAPAGQQLERAIERGGLEPADAERRIAAQVSGSERQSRADIVIRNAGSLEELERAVDDLWHALEARGAQA